jgi:hypothetical protein
MRMALVAVALITLIVGAVNAQDNKSANYILPGCRHVAPMASGYVGSADLNFKAGICVGQVSAIAVAAPLLREDIWCIPDSVTRGQMVQVVIRWIEERPNRMQEPFVTLAMLALMDAWACKK